MRSCLQLLLFSAFTLFSFSSLQAQCAPTISNELTGGQLIILYGSPEETPDNLGRIQVTFSDFTGLYQVFLINGNYQTQSPVFDALTLTGEVTFLFTDDSEETCTYSNGILNTGLPVEFSAFEGLRKDDDVMLYWSTETEQDNAGFSIQRSFDGNNFEKIGGMRGAGNSDVTQNYSFEDKAVRWVAPTSTLYYRLLQYDFDGAISYSEIIAVELDKALDKFQITKITGWDTAERQLSIYYYNPSNAIHKIRYQLVDINGRVLVSDAVFPEVGFNTFSIDLSRFRSPLFFLAMNNGEELISEKIALGLDY